MDKEYIIIIVSTNKSLLEGSRTSDLLKNIHYKNPDTELDVNFGSKFYPVIAITREGEIKIITESDKCPEDIVLFVIPDNCIEGGFIDFIKKFPDATSIYALLHTNGKQTQKQENTLKEYFPEKLHVAADGPHHHNVVKYSDKHVLGNGLEAIAESIDYNKQPLSVSAEVLKRSIEYMISKPSYRKPYQDYAVKIIALIQQYMVNGQNKDEISEDLRSDEFKSMKINDLEEISEEELFNDSKFKKLKQLQMQLRGYII